MTDCIVGSCVSCASCASIKLSQTETPAGETQWATATTTNSCSDDDNNDDDGESSSQKAISGSSCNDVVQVLQLPMIMNSSPEEEGEEGKVITATADESGAIKGEDKAGITTEAVAAVEVTITADESASTGFTGEAVVSKEEEIGISSDNNQSGEDDTKKDDPFTDTVKPTTTTAIVSPPPPENDPWEWAYEIWHSKGLMRSLSLSPSSTLSAKRGQLRSADAVPAPPPVPPSMKRTDIETRQSMGPGTATIKSHPWTKTTINHGGTSATNNEYGRMSLPGAAGVAAANSNNNGGQGGKREFSSILEKWKKKSDNEKPSTSHYFLSPARGAPTPERSQRGVRQQIICSTPVVTEKRMQGDDLSIKDSVSGVVKPAATKVSEDDQQLGGSTSNPIENEIEVLTQAKEPKREQKRIPVAVVAPKVLKSQNHRHSLQNYYQNHHNSRKPRKPVLGEDVNSVNTTTAESIRRPVSQASRLKTAFGAGVRDRRDSSASTAAAGLFVQQQQAPHQQKKKMSTTNINSKKKTLPKSNSDYKSAVQVLLDGMENQDLEVLKSFSGENNNGDGRKDEVGANNYNKSRQTGVHGDNSKGANNAANKKSQAGANEVNGIVETATACRSGSIFRREPSVTEESEDESLPGGCWVRDLRHLYQYKEQPDRPPSSVIIKSRRGSLRATQTLLPSSSAQDITFSSTCAPSGISLCSAITSTGKSQQERTSNGTASRRQRRATTCESDWMKLLANEDDSSCEEELKRRQSTPRDEALSFSARPWRRDMVLRQVDSYDQQSVVSAITAKSQDQTEQRHQNRQNIKEGEEGGALCMCADSVFSGKDEFIDFYLPLMGQACTCGANVAKKLRNPEEPSSLENILRPWQVEFLAAFGIYRGDQLVKAHHRSAKALSNAMRKYRKKMGMTPFPTKSCTMALSIWSKTSKAFVRSIRKQLTEGNGTGNNNEELKMPNTLYILSSFLEKISNDDELKPTTVSTPRAS